MNNGARVRYFKAGLVLAAQLLATLCLVAQNEPIFPTEKGTYWIYEGTVEWTHVNSNKTSSEKLRWKMEVVETVERAGVTATLFKGDPSDLAWYSPETTRGDWLLVQAGNRFYLLNDHRAWQLLQALKGLSASEDARRLLDEQDIWFVLPLKPGKKFCEPEQEQREDTFYCWFVEKEALVHLTNVKGVPSAGYREYKLAFRTNPDHQFVGLVPGIGVSSYDYSHHGSVAEAHVRLVEFGRVKAETAAPARHR